MAETPDKSKSRLVDLYLKELSINNPTAEQRRIASKANTMTLCRPIIERMLSENKTTGQIANTLQIKPSTVRGEKMKINKQSKSVSNNNA